MKQMERGAEDEEAGEVEKERGEQGSKVKQREMGVMACMFVFEKSEQD